MTIGSGEAFKGSLGKTLRKRKNDNFKVLPREIMDTDDLTEMAYRTIVLAEEFCDYLKCDIGDRARGSSTEDEYLRDILVFLNDILLEPEEYLESWSLEEEVEAAWFQQRVVVVIIHVNRTLATPIEKRGPTAFN